MQANAIGRSAKTVREYLEKNYSEEVAESRRETEKLGLFRYLYFAYVGNSYSEFKMMSTLCCL